MAKFAAGWPLSVLFVNTVVCRFAVIFPYKIVPLVARNGVHLKSPWFKVKLELAISNVVEAHAAKAMPPHPAALP